MVRDVIFFVKRVVLHIIIYIYPIYMQLSVAQTTNFLHLMRWWGWPEYSLNAMKIIKLSKWKLFINKYLFRKMLPQIFVLRYRHTIIMLNSVTVYYFIIPYHICKYNFHIYFQSCIQYCSDSGYSEATDLAVKLNKSLTLNDTLIRKLTNITGNFVISSQAELKA